MKMVITCLRAPISIEWINIGLKSGYEIVGVDFLNYPIASFQKGVEYIKISSPKDDFEKYKEEILKKSVILRDAAINTMLGNSVATANSKKMRKALKDTLNEQLSDSEIEEVYFNQFIIQ